MSRVGKRCLLAQQHLNLLKLHLLRPLLLILQQFPMFPQEQSVGKQKDACTPYPVTDSEDVRPANALIYWVRHVRGRGALAAEPGGGVRNRSKGANCLSAASFRPAEIGRAHV